MTQRHRDTEENRFCASLALLVCLVLTGCSTDQGTVTIRSKEESAPPVFRVAMDTSKGPVLIEVHRDWAPVGADHFYSLVKNGFYDGVRFFRVVRGFVVQFGINGDPKTNGRWSNVNLPDDPVKETNVKGTVTYAKGGPNTRSTQLFINLRDNSRLDRDGFAPIGRVIGGMDVVESFYDSYGDMPPNGQGPDPSQIQVQGNEYLQNRFPRLDYIRKTMIQ